VTRDKFINLRRPEWRRFEILLEKATNQRMSKLTGEEIAELSARYRSLCFDLSLIQSRDWGTTMTRYLNGLVGRGHNCLYRSQPGSYLALVRFLTAEFPRLLRANGRFFLVALVLFVVPGLIAGTAVAIDPSLAGRIVPGQNQEMFEQMYSNRPSERQEGMEGAMAGFYVRNNVGIAFKCFALGSFAGIGTVVVLVFNSIFLGAVTGFVVGRGYSDNFFEFVIGHGSFELTAIVISGAAGLMIGHAIIHPGQKTRWDALRTRGLDAVKIALGAGFMLLIAALIEGFWSPSAVSRDVKMIVGVFLWGVVILYLSLAGREQSVELTLPLEVAAGADAGVSRQTDEESRS
jgi:uncharacterized membrane protein SpoIIM required for sporulation